MILPASNLENGWTNIRRDNTINYLQLFKENIDIEVIKEYLAKDIDLGGASFLLNAYNQTLCQSIIIPVELELYINLQDETGWQTIDLYELFEL